MCNTERDKIGTLKDSIKKHLHFVVGMAIIFIESPSYMII